ncbi:MAG: O-antigen ligase family protein [Bacteroidetes bacterium]|nr:O-antigen ligase family protein [Bacteroidota bacterium]
MKRWIGEDQLLWVIVGCCQLVFIGFVASRALASIGMMSMLLVSLLFYGGDTFKNYFARKEWWILSLFFWIVLFSGIYSEDKTSWMNWVRIKLPYIALPLAFAPLKKLSTKQITALLYGFILVFAVSTIVVLVRYFLNYEAITESFSRGNGIPMPYSHIRYSLMLAFSFFCCLWLLERKEYLFGSKERWVLILLAAFAFVALHILSVRSGLLALYIGVIFLAWREAFRRKRIFQSLLVVVAVSILPYLAYHFLPGFHNKIEYMKWDLAQYREGNINDYSDAMRLVSMKVGMQIWKQHPLIGVGSGDLKIESDKVHASDYPEISEQNRRIPHNQFIWVLATTGVIGLLLFLMAFFVPLVVNGHYKLWILTLLHLILFSSFLTEDTLEEQIGTGFYLIFLLVFINYDRRNE